MVENIMIAYNYMGEVAGLIMSALIFGVMLYTKPKRTYVYKYVFWGNILSIIAVLLQISILEVANNPDKYFNRYIFMFQLMAFLLAYNGILYMIFSYVNMMSIVRRSQRKEFLLMYAVLSGIYVLGVIVEIASRKLYELELDYIDISHFTRYYCCAGIVCGVICFNATITNIKNVARVIWHAVFFIVPLDLFVLVMQIFVVGEYHFIFSAITYVPVFALGYILFHATPYDEISGCQSIHALEAFLSKRSGKKKMYLSYVVFSLPRLEDIGNDGTELALKGIAACRDIESISSKVRMYKISDDKYVNLINTSNETEFIGIVNQLRGILDRVKAELPLPFNYIMISTPVIPEMGDAIKYRQYLEYITKQFEDRNSSHFYIAKPSDYDAFMEEYEISSTLKDIRNRLDYDDDRILIYAQPIYSVETGSFRVAEALARLKVGDRIIYPDRFIPIAEASGTIHAITCIVLDKVCRNVQYFSEFYDFDAISINCSSKELSQENMQIDLLDILERYDIDVSKVRLEITESAMFEDFEMAQENMQTLTRAGIQFYLDDFGTGYSSLERVMNCPFKTIKFDKTLLYKSLDDSRMNDILTYMIEVFKKNGFGTVMEGVEDESQSQYSLERGFDYIQGFHFARPEPIEEMKKYFSRIKKF